MSMSIDSTEAWDKAESLTQMAYDSGADCYIVSLNDEGHEVKTPVEDVVMMIHKDVEVGLMWYDCWFMTQNHPPAKFIDAVLFVDKQTGEELSFDVYEVTKNVRGKSVGYDLLTETKKYK